MRSHKVCGGSRRAGPVVCGWAGLALMVVVAAGCGDDSVEALPKEDYVAQANAICAATNDAVDPAFGEFFATLQDLEGPAGFVDAWDTLFDEVVTPAFNEQMIELRALAAPTGDADMLVVLYDDLDQALVEYNAILDDAVAGDMDAIESISTGDAENANDDVDQRARDYGLTVCGEDE